MLLSDVCLTFVCLRCVCSAAREGLGRPRGEERGRGILCLHAHSLLVASSRQCKWPLHPSNSISGRPCGLAPRGSCLTSPHSAFPFHDFVISGSASGLVGALLAHAILANRSYIGRLSSDAVMFMLAPCARCRCCLSVDVDIIQRLLCCCCCWAYGCGYNYDSSTAILPRYDHSTTYVTTELLRSAA